MSATSDRLVLICNGRPGRKTVARAMPAVETELRRRGLDYDLHYTTGPGDATKRTRAAIDDGTTIVVAVGGDGTVHEVVNGMLEEDRAVNPEVALGVIGAGTGSDFIKTFGIPANPVHAVRHLDGPESFPIDVGKITFERDGEPQVRYFANVAEVGIGAEVVARAERLPRWLGPTVYLAAFWLTLRAFRSANASVDLVDRTYEGPINNVIVANGQFFGGGMRIAPRAAPTDGLLDVQIEHASKREAVAIIPKIYKGEHVPHPDIEEAKRVRCSVTAERPLLVEADGEVLGHTPATFEVLTSAISLKV